LLPLRIYIGKSKKLTTYVKKYLEYNIEGIVAEILFASASSVQKDCSGKPGGE
jgi:hypothetical protein